jgi:hypothetical protein
MSSPSPRFVSRAKRRNTQAIAVAEPPSPNVKIEDEAIARLAYSYWEARGRQGGSPEEDWLRAEQQLRSS